MEQVRERALRAAQDAWHKLLGSRARHYESALLKMQEPR
jgi:hypothetical protein